MISENLVNVVSFCEAVHAEFCVALQRSTESHVDKAEPYTKWIDQQLTNMRDAYPIYPIGRCGISVSDLLQALHPFVATVDDGLDTLRRKLKKWDTVLSSLRMAVRNNELAAQRREERNKFILDTALVCAQQVIASWFCVQRVFDQLVFRAESTLAMVPASWRAMMESTAEFKGTLRAIGYAHDQWKDKYAAVAAVAKLEFDDAVRTAQPSESLLAQYAEVQLRKQQDADAVLAAARAAAETARIRKGAQITSEYYRLKGILERDFQQHCNAVFTGRSSEVASNNMSILRDALAFPGYDRSPQASPLATPIGRYVSGAAAHGGLPWLTSDLHGSDGTRSPRLDKSVYDAEHSSANPADVSGLMLSGSGSGFHHEVVSKATLQAFQARLAILDANRDRDMATADAEFREVLEAALAQWDAACAASDVEYNTACRSTTESQEATIAALTQRYNNDKDAADRERASVVTALADQEALGMKAAAARLDPTGEFSESIKAMTDTAQDILTITLTARDDIAYKYHHLFNLVAPYLGKPLYEKVLHTEAQQRGGDPASAPNITWPTTPAVAADPTKWSGIARLPINQNKRADVPPPPPASAIPPAPAAPSSPPPLSLALIASPDGSP